MFIINTKLEPERCLKLLVTLLLYLPVKPLGYYIFVFQLGDIYVEKNYSIDFSCFYLGL